MNVRARAEKGIAGHIDASSVVWTFIDNGKLPNQIARLVAIMVKLYFAIWYVYMYVCMYVCQRQKYTRTILNFITTANITELNINLTINAIKAINH